MSRGCAWIRGEVGWQIWVQCACAEGQALAAQTPRLHRKCRRGVAARVVSFSVANCSGATQGPLQRCSLDVSSAQTNSASQAHESP